MWSLGCILAELLTGYPLLPGEDESDQLACIIELIGMPSQKLLDASKRAKNFVSSKGYPRYCTVTTLPDGTTVLNGGRSRRGKTRGPPGSKDWNAVLKGCDDPQFLDFLKQCLEWDPALRMTPSQALRHQWLRRKLPKPPTGTTIGEKTPSSKRGTTTDGTITSISKLATSSTTTSSSSKTRTNLAAITDANGNIQPRTVLPKLVSWEWMHPTRCDGSWELHSGAASSTRLDLKETEWSWFVQLWRAFVFFHSVGVRSGQMCRKARLRWKHDG